MNEKKKTTTTIAAASRCSGRNGESRSSNSAMLLLRPFDWLGVCCALHAGEQANFLVWRQHPLVFSFCMRCCSASRFGRCPTRPPATTPSMEAAKLRRKAKFQLVSGAAASLGTADGSRCRKPKIHVSSRPNDCDRRRFDLVSLLIRSVH